MAGDRDGEEDSRQGSVRSWAPTRPLRLSTVPKREAGAQGWLHRPPGRERMRSKHIYIPTQSASSPGCPLEAGSRGGSACATVPVAVTTSPPPSAGQGAQLCLSCLSPPETTASPRRCAGIKRGSYLIKVGMGEGYKTLRHPRCGGGGGRQGMRKSRRKWGQRRKKYRRGDLMALFWWELFCPLPTRSEAVCLHALRR